jgi:hypothetical protein
MEAAAAPGSLQRPFPGLFAQEDSPGGMVSISGVPAREGKEAAGQEATIWEKGKKGRREIEA